MNFSTKIGDIKFSSPFFMAPLAGITDAAMRRICEDCGAAMTYTEMVSAKGIFYGDKKTEKLLYIDENAGPTAIQIFGSEPDVIAYASRYLNDRKNKILDINMGCPVPKVVKNGDGAALLKNPDLVYDIIKAAVSNTDKAVTVKIRKGFDENHINAVEIANAAEAAGAAAVCVHGRTREQFYQGEADWEIIKHVKESLSIPVIGNGDVFSGEDGIRMMKETGCDFVMVARGALGNPWIFKELLNFWRNGDTTSVKSIKDISTMMLRHFNDLVELKGEYSAVREMRKHAAWYTKGMKGAAKFRSYINTVESAKEMRGVLKIEEQKML